MTEPVPYGRHASAEPGTACSVCGTIPSRPVTDHCHEHGWVRGTVCLSCNSMMGLIDRRIAPRVSRLTYPLAALIAHAGKCAGCPPVDTDSLGPMPKKDLGLMRTSPRVEMTFRLPRDLRDRVKAYASRRGLSVNGVGNLALDEFLRAEDARLGSPPDSASKTRGARSK